MPDAPELHSDCVALAPLLGIWRGRGDGHFSTIDDFQYLEEFTFAHVGKPFLSMTQHTRDSSTGQPLHAESGYLRALGDGTVELVVAQPSGIVEVDVGRVVVLEHGVELDLFSEQVVTTPSAKEVTEIRRRIIVDGDEMVVDMWMAAVGEPLQHHLHSQLLRG